MSRQVLYLSAQDRSMVTILHRFIQSDFRAHFRQKGLSVLLEAGPGPGPELGRLLRSEQQQLGRTDVGEVRQMWLDPGWSDYRIARALSTLSHLPSKLLLVHASANLTRRLLNIERQYTFMNPDTVLLFLGHAEAERLADLISCSNTFLLQQTASNNDEPLSASYSEVLRAAARAVASTRHIHDQHDRMRQIKVDLAGHFTANEYRYNNFTVFKLYKHESQRKWIECFRYTGDRTTYSNIACQNYGFLSQDNFKKVYVSVIPTDPFIRIDAASEIYINEESHTPECGHNVVCYEVPWQHDQSSFDIYRYIKELQRNLRVSKNINNIRCCYGFSITLLQKLAMDLRYELTFYIVKNQTYGELSRRQQWNGMVQDILDGSAHIGAGAFSITVQREQYIDMSDPYYTSDMEILNLTEERESFLGAVFRPFKLQLWLLIFALATVCAIALATLEWRSPFGLNPWGRQRKKNYTISSALNSVYAIMFGHTIKTKAPKSWPVKWVQNCWAFACIVIVAMYTANLTVFIAGVADSTASDNGVEFKVANQDIGTTRYSNIIDSLRDLNDKRYPVNKWKIKYLESSDIAEKMLINKSLSIYMDESLVIKTLKIKLSYCNVKTRKINLGPIGYGLGFSKNSLIKEEIKHRLRIYGDFGFFDFLDKSASEFNYECKKTRVNDGIDKITKEGYKIENMAGLFVALSVGFLVSFIVLFLEHMLYWWIVPRWHRLPSDSVWKSIHIMFFSQRLHRIIHSERLILPTETTKEMIDIVKNREFGKMFFKENVQKPIVSRRASPSKMTVFDISSEMVKMKRQSKSQESVVLKPNHHHPNHNHNHHRHHSITNCYSERSKSYDGSVRETVDKYCHKFLSFREASTNSSAAGDGSNRSSLYLSSQDNSLRIAFHNPIEEDEQGD